jgi:hypothetical protein
VLAQAIWFIAAGVQLSGAGPETAVTGPAESR